MAPFNRYRTLDVVRGVVAARRRGPRHAVHRQRRPHRARPAGAVRRASAATRRCTVRIRGGLLGHWSVWTRSAVELLRAHPRRRRSRRVDADAARAGFARHRLQQRLLRRGARLRRLHRRLPRGAAPPGPAARASGAWTRTRALSPGQAAEIDRVCREHADLADDAFVARESGALAGADVAMDRFDTRTRHATRWACWRTCCCCWPGTCSCAWATCRKFVMPSPGDTLRRAVVAELRLVDQHRGHRHRDLRRLLPRAGGRRAAGAAVHLVEDARIADACRCW